MLIGSFFGLYVTEQTKPVFRLFLTHLFSSNLKESCEITLHSKGNLPIYVHLDGIAGEDGKNCYLTLIEITDLKLAEEQLKLSREQLSFLVNEMQVGVLLQGPKAEIIMSNPRALELLGLDQDQLMGLSSFSPEWNVIYEDGSPFPGPTHPVPQAIKTKNRVIDVVMGVYRPKTRDRVWLLVSAVPQLNIDRTVQQVVCTFIDISKRKRAERELLEAKEKAEESDKLKSAFLANMSHEIRTPMNGILGFAELLKEEKLSSEDQKEYIRLIEKSGARMLNIINDLVDISKIESGQMNVNITESNINEQIEYIYTFFKPEVEQKGIQFYFKNALPSKEAVIETDREKVFAILTNLVKNAIKFTDQGLIEFGYEVDNPTELQFFVKDTGIGIPKEMQETIFERFIQVEIGNKRAYQGAGLGLAITKNYVEMLGGRIWVESEKGKGSQFFFTLPVRCKSGKKLIEEKRNSADPSENLIKTLKILIVEDIFESAKYLEIIVRSVAKTIIKAGSGVEAVAACRNNPDIDLILMDIQMPEMNGYKAVQEIRKFNPEVVIIAQTAYAQKGDMEKVMKAGFNNYLTKPIIKIDLLNLINSYFGE